MEDVIDPHREIEGLVRFQGRGPGTDAERRAAEHLRARLHTLGREATVETAWIRPTWPLAFTGYVLAGVVGSIVSTGAATAGAIIAGLALVAALADLSGRLHLGRRLTGRRATQNVVSREDGRRPGTLVLTAHYDAAPTGFVYGRSAERRAALGKSLRRPIGPFAIVVYALAAVLAMAILRAAGNDAMAVAIVQ